MISVIIPNQHSPLIGNVISALRRQTARHLIHEIIVVGQDPAGQVQQDALVRMIALDELVAAGVARNRGLTQASASLVLFIDADCVAASTLVERLVACYRDGHRIVGGAIALPTSNYWSLSDHLVSFTNFLPSAAGGQRSYLLTSNLLMERALLVESGGFDERFAGAAGEDVDLSFRLRQRGLELCFEPRAVVIHCSSRQSLTSILRHLMRYGQAHATLRQQYRDLYPTPSSLQPFLQRPLLLILSLPLAGLVRLMGMVRKHPILWRYWYVWPAIVGQQMAWCWGFARQLQRQQAA